MAGRWAYWLRELHSLYDSFAAGQPGGLEPLTAQYADYAARERAYWDRDRQRHCGAFWKMKLKGVSGDLARCGRWKSCRERRNLPLGFGSTARGMAQECGDVVHVLPGSVRRHAASRHWPGGSGDRNRPGQPCRRGHGEDDRPVREPAALAPAVYRRSIVRGDRPTGSSGNSARSGNTRLRSSRSWLP